MQILFFMTKYNALLFLFARNQNYYVKQNEILAYLREHLTRDYQNLCQYIDKLFPGLPSLLEAADNYPKLLASGNDLKYVIYGDELYPAEFYFLQEPPLIFSYQGSPCWVDSHKFTVVGSRNPTEKSIHWMSLELGKIVSATNWVTVSGGAIGVDQWIHQMSIRARKKTIAILPSGLERLYPSNMRKLSQEIISCGGCILSEFFPFEEVRKYHFQFRNRLIAALNQKCLVIEAKEKSGSLITGHFVIAMGKDLLVLPGHPLDPNFKGSHELLKTGGVLFTCHEDFNNF